MQQRLKTLGCAAILALAGSPAVADDDRVEHFEGKPSETLEEAVSNLSETNAKLEALLAKEKLSGSEMGEIHKLSYTLENALARVDEELETMAEQVEAVHIGSETGDTETVKRDGRAYLETIRLLVD